MFYRIVDAVSTKLKAVMVGKIVARGKEWGKKWSKVKVGWCGRVSLSTWTVSRWGDAAAHSAKD